MNSSRRSGTTLVEILVVIVVFMIGILAIAQIFPGGLRILEYSQFDTMATSLGRSEMEMLKNHADQLPEDIVPVQFV
ncbi:MAG TPA: prepilin-type N-terminal cleavage/methylation domain-containing protein, partial [Fimbriimonadaceae bacterium]|nr:prepilin-type N-terminal cleavage/methylation domain-containing protein [Fimbriimonadaceae bacterium]